MGISEPKAARIRREIVAKAVDLASVEGLEGLTIGRLAESIPMSKSGLSAHFGSKQELQLAVIEAAAEIFTREVLARTEAAEGGLQRLVQLSSHWLRYVEKGLFRGGCFFASASTEVDDRPGPARDRVVDLTGAWTRALETATGEAVAAGDLSPATDPAQVAFEIHAFIQEANWAFQLHGEAGAFRRARQATRRCLESAATPAGRALLAG